MILHPAHWQRVKTLFEESLDLPPDARSAFLDVACHDVDIKAEVLQLLKNHAEMAGFLSEDAETISAPLIENMPARFSAGQFLANRFRVIRFIAKGGMGEVYEALDLELSTPVAIKMIRPDLLNAEFLDRFKREVQIAKRVTHPNVCRVYDLFRHSDETGAPIYLISMELLSSETLARRLRGTKRLGPHEAMRVIVQIAAALESAHSAAVLHRDLKPENIMLINRDGGQRAVVMDFGIARPVSAGLENSETSALSGTPAYMSPEQRENRELTPASDIYSLGLLMYRIATGTPAPDQINSCSSQTKRIFGRGESPIPLAAGFSRSWERAIFKCLETNPSRRYPSARAVAEALVQKPPHPLRGLFGVAAALLVIGLMVAWGIVARRGFLSPGALPATRPTIAVLRFTDQSGNQNDNWISTVLSSYLTENLSTGGRLDLVSQDRVVEFDRDNAITEVPQRRTPFLSKTREVLAADFVLSGSYSVVNGTIYIGTVLAETRRGRSFAQHSEKLPFDKLLIAAARSATAMRKQLGVPESKPDELEESRSSLPQTLEAMRLYANGLDKLHSLDAQAARDLLEQAVASDPVFPLGHAALADAWSMLGYSNRSLTEAKRAFDSSGKLSWASRLVVEARYREANREWSLASDVYRRLWSSNPSHFDYGLSLAGAEISAGRFYEAQKALERIRTISAFASSDPRLDLIDARAAPETNHVLEEQSAAKAVEKALRRGQTSLAASAMRERGWALILLGRAKEAAGVFKEARKIFEQQKDTVNASRTLVNLVTALGGQVPNSERLLMDQEALVVFKATGTLDAQAMVSNNLAGIFEESGDESKALDLYDQAAKLYQEVGDERHWALAVSNIGSVQQGLGNLDDAARSYERAIAKFSELHSDGSRAGALENLADVLRIEGRLKSAEKACREAHEIRLRINMNSTGIAASACLAEIFWDQGRLVEAAPIYRRNLESSRGRDPSGTVSALRSVSLVLMEQGNLMLAQSDIDEAISMQSVIEKSELGLYELAKAEIDLEDGQASSAAQFARRAVGRFQANRWLYDEAEAHLLLSRALLALGEWETAHAELMRAQILLPKILSPKIRIEFLLQSGRVALGSSDKARIVPAERDIEMALSLTRRFGMWGYQLRARLEKARVEMKMNDEASAATELQEIATEAQSRGFTLISSKAKRMLVNPKL